jgi:hypothetical protein
VAEFALDIQPYVSDIVKRVREVADEQIKSYLREAFDAGVEHGIDIEAIGSGWTPDPVAPDFEEWLRTFIERHAGGAA